jgi:hypothetical protein
MNPLRIPDHGKKNSPRAYVFHSTVSYIGLDVCNGNRINDAHRCGNSDCRVRLMCDRIALRRAVEG